MAPGAIVAPVPLLRKPAPESRKHFLGSFERTKIHPNRIDTGNAQNFDLFMNGSTVRFFEIRT